MREGGLRKSRGDDRAARSRLAFTLLETLIATQILCVVFFIVMSLFPSSLMSLRKGRDLISATHIAQRVIEEKRLERFDTLAGGRQQENCDGVVFDVDVEVTGINDDVKRIVAVVSWDGPTSGRSSVSFETRLFGFKHP